MATKFYLHRSTFTGPGTMPGASALGGTPDNTSTGAATNRWIDETISAAAQLSINHGTLANTNPQTGWFTRHVSAPLAAQTISAQTITYSQASSESNAATNYNPTIYISLWRPSTGSSVGAIMAVGTITVTEPGTTQTAGSATGTSTSQTAVDGDVIIIETWRKSVAQGNANARLETLFYDGTTEASTTDVASFVSFANTLTFLPIVAAPTSASLTVTGGTPAVTVSTSAYAAVVIADTPIAYWRLGESVGTIATDVIGANNGTYTNTPTLGVSGLLTGDAGTAVTLLHSSVEYVEAAALSLGNGPLSYECWIKRTSTPSTFFQVLMDGGVGTPGLAIDQGSNPSTQGSISFYSGTVGFAVETNPFTINDTNRHHIVGTKSSGNTWKIYVDGVDQTNHVTGSPTTATNTTPFRIGQNRGSPTTESFDGTVEEVAVYNYVLTPAQVLAHFAAGAPVPTAAGMILAGATPTITVSDNITAQPTAGSMALTGATPTVATPVVSLPTTVALMTTLATPTVTIAATGVVSLPTPASLVTTLATPAVVTPVVTVPTAASLAITTATPAVSTPRVAQPSAAALALAFGTPAVTIAVPLVALPTAASLTVTGHVPSVVVSNHISVNPSAAALVLAGVAPNIALSIYATPQAAALYLAFASPLVTLTHSPLPPHVTASIERIDEETASIVRIEQDQATIAARSIKGTIR